MIKLKKKKNSYWQVNNQKFIIGKSFINRAPLRSEIRFAETGFNIDNDIALVFQSPDIANADRYKLDYVSGRPYTCELIVHMNDNIYYVSPTSNQTYVYASMTSSGKHKYELESTWMYNSRNNIDSILVSGLLIEQ